MPLAQRASPDLGVETEGARQKTATLALGELGKQVSHLVEELGVCRRIAPWSPTDRTLIDFDQLIQKLDPLNRSVSPRRILGAIQRIAQGWRQDIRDQ